MKSSRCLLGIALLGCLSIGYAQDYEVADFGERMPTNNELVEALMPLSSAGTGDIAMHDGVESQAREKAKIVLHGTAEPQIPSQDTSLEPQRVATHESWDSRDRSRDLPQARQQMGRQQAGRQRAGRQKAISLQVQFNFNSTELTPASKARLGVVASALNTGKLANYKFRIEGHTDSVGSAQYNLKLSEHRARSVARHLTEQYHIEPSRLQTLGKGMSEPANPASPRAPENRRVVIVNVGRS